MGTHAPRASYAMMGATEEGQLDWMLEASSDPVWVFVVFFGALVFCHYLLIFRYPLKLKQWKLVEYMWVGLALVSIFGIVEQARFFGAKLTIEQSRGDAMNKIMALESWFDVYREYACVDNADNAGFRQLCLWTKLKASDLRLIIDNEDFPVDLPANFLNGVDHSQTGLADADQAIVSKHHSGYLAARTQYLVAQKKENRSDFSVLLVALAPMIFAVAVAIKFTKVTGEYRLTK